MELIHFYSREKYKEKSNIKLAKNGDNEAFTILINEQLTAMYRVSRGILKREEDIEDSIQNTILIVFNKLRTLRNDKYFKTWLIRILINECNKIHNNNKKRIEENVEETYVVEKCGEIDLYDAIKKLPEEFRVTTILYYFDDMSYKEISEVLNIAEGTVKSRISRSKKILYKILKGNE